MIDYYHNGLVITQILCLHFSGILMGKYSCFLLLFYVLHPNKVRFFFDD